MILVISGDLCEISGNWGGVHPSKLLSFETCVEQLRYPSPLGYSSALAVRDLATEGFAVCNSSVLTSAMALCVERTV